MIALFKKGSPIILAIHNYADSFGSAMSNEIIGKFNHKLDSHNNIEVVSDTASIAGLIGTLADMGEGDCLISAKFLRIQNE